MTWRRLLVPACSGVLLLILGGCTSPQTALPVSRDTPLVLGLDDLEAEARVARAQTPERERQLPSAPVQQAASSSPPRPQLPLPPTTGQTQEKRGNLSVRAWVNTRPIFDEEVKQGIARRVQELREVPPSQIATALAKLDDEELNQLIERELILQDAYKKLEKNQKVLDKLKQAAGREFDKKVDRIVKQLQKDGRTAQEVQRQLGKEMLEALRRQEERNFIASEYMRSRIHPQFQKVGHEQIVAYYTQHLSEFRTEDKVHWQHLFIMNGGPHGSTPAEARRFAEQILDRVRRGEPFDNFLHLDDGTSWKFRKGEGEGQKPGMIRPAELERSLFALKEGDLGPLVELGTGYHLFRVVKREYAGQLPFDDKVQLRIANKLRGEIAEREYKRVVKELRERAVVAIEGSTTP